MTDVEGAARDPVERAHLTASSRTSPPVPRRPVADDLRELARSFWLPTWDYPPGEVHTQFVLQYPVCLLVVTATYARLYGVTTGLSTTDLEGRGWAVGLMLQPAAGRLLWGQPVHTVTDGHVPLEQVPGLDGAQLRDEVRRAVGDDPEDPAGRSRAVEAVERQLRRHLPVDAEGSLVNALVARVEGDRNIRRVGDLAAAFGLGERTLQRVVRDRVGVSPRWLIARRRLHEAALRLRTDDLDLATLAVQLGYADQSHLTRDWKRVTGTTPAAYRADQPVRGRPDTSVVD